MKTRIITAAIAIPLLLIILLVAPEIVAALVNFLWIKKLIFPSAGPGSL